MSSKKLKLTVNQKTYEVEVGDLSDSPVTVTVNGKTYTVDYSTVDEAVTPTTAAPSAPVVAAVAPAPATAPTAAAASGDVTAPMPGVIVEVLVKPGDTVTSGQEVCVLEAMKMKNAIRSPRDGVVSAVPVSAGQKVAYGATLVAFE